MKLLWNPQIVKKRDGSLSQIGKTAGKVLTVLSFLGLGAHFQSCSDVDITINYQEDLDKKFQNLQEVKEIINAYSEILKERPDLFAESQNVLKILSYWPRTEDDGAFDEKKAYLQQSLALVSDFKKHVEEFVAQKRALEGIVTTGAKILGYESDGKGGLSKNCHPRTQDDGDEFTTVKDKEVEDVINDETEENFTSQVDQFEKFMYANDNFIKHYFPDQRSHFLQQVKANPALSPEEKYRVYEEILKELNAFFRVIYKLDKMVKKIEIILYGFTENLGAPTCDMYGNAVNLGGDAF